MERDELSKFATGLLAGVVIGVAVGFLYAPRRGAETREMLLHRAEEMKQKAEVAAAKAKKAADEAAAAVKSKLPHKESQVESPAE
jgi:gas vesicle protein